MDISPPLPDPPARQRAMRIFILLCGLFLFVTMPDTVTPGDCYASRAEAANLVMTGQLGIDYTHQAEVALINEKRGEFFFANDAKQRLFNKWGIMNTLLYLPPMLATRLVRGSVGVMDKSTTQLFFINCNNVLLSMLILCYLNRILSLYTPRAGQRMLFITLSLFTTYLWFHLRAQMHEIFQVTMTVGLLYHFLVSLRAAEANDLATRWRHLAWALAWTGGLVLTKVLYVTVLGAVWLFAWLAGPRQLTVPQRLKENLDAHRLPLLRYLVLPTALVLIILFSVNSYKTGSSLDAGYSQETFTGLNEISFSLAVLKESVPGFLVLPGNANIFLHYPLLLLALFGIPRFARRWPTDSAFLAFTVISNFFIISSYQTWRGEWGDGPRYLIIFALMASLPAIETMTAIREQGHKPRVKGAALLFAIISLWSGVMQVAENSMPNFSFYYYEGFFDQFDDPEINAYFSHYLTRGMIYGDILAYAHAGRPFPPVEMLRKNQPEWFQENAQRLHAGIMNLARPNYFFVRLAKDLLSAEEVSAPPSATGG